MLYSVFVFILLVLLSGGIAFLGDYIGRYLGKKRLTVFGLRPKHTAIVSTIITGMLISFVALLVLTGINREFRDVVFHGKQIMENNKKLEKESQSLILEKENLLKSNEKLSKQEKKIKIKNDILEKATKILENKNLLLGGKVKESQKLANLYKTKAFDLKNKASVLEKNVLILKSDYNKKKIDLENAQKAKKLAEENILFLKNDIAKQEKELVAIKEEGENLSDLLKEKQETLDETKEKLKNQEKNLKDIEEQLSEARINLDDTLKSLEVANRELETYSNLRLNDVIVKQDDEIIRTVIDNNASLIDIREALTKFVLAGIARCNKLSRKLKINETGLLLAYKSETGEILMVDEKRLIDSAADLIKENKNDRTLVIISSVGNFTAKDLDSEPLVTEFKILEDKLLYKKGSKVTSKYFDGKQTEPYVFSDVYSFVTNDLCEIVGNKGMVLRQQSLLDDNSKVANKIEIQLNLTREINNTDSMCLVNVKAKENIYSHDIYSSDLFEFEVLKVK